MKNEGGEKDRDPDVACREPAWSSRAPTVRKRVTGRSRPEPQEAMAPDRWLDLERLARVEVTSEEAAHPIEAALRPGMDAGWRAAQPGEQTIRLIFDQPQRLRRIGLLFVEPEMARTQEFVLRWSPDEGRSFREIVRQQWNFSPSGAVRKVESYRVDLWDVTALELAIVPDQRGGTARASLAEWRLA